MSRDDFRMGPIEKHKFRIFPYDLIAVSDYHSRLYKRGSMDYNGRYNDGGR